MITVFFNADYFPQQPPGPQLSLTSGFPEQHPQQVQSTQVHSPPVLQASQHLHSSPQQHDFLAGQFSQHLQSVHAHSPPVSHALQQEQVSPQEQFPVLFCALEIETNAIAALTTNRAQNNEIYLTLWDMIFLLKQC